RRIVRPDLASEASGGARSGEYRGGVRTTEFGELWPVSESRPRFAEGTRDAPSSRRAGRPHAGRKLPATAHASGRSRKDAGRVDQGGEPEPAGAVARLPTADCRPPTASPQAHHIIALRQLSLTRVQARHRLVGHDHRL